jgi:mannitol/fructose-specific phosphotransferase system IIA component (Ntr-type)
VSLREALAGGGIVLDLAARSRDQALVELVQAIPRRRLPAGVDREQIVALALKREEELPTDLGNGVAIPHARCPGLAAPLVVFGRSTDGVVFSTASSELVHLVFLLVTPLERPEAQLALLSQLAKIAGTVEGRDALVRASFPGDVADVLQGRAGNAPRDAG